MIAKISQTDAFLDRMASRFIAEIAGQNVNRYEADGRWITIGANKEAPRGEKGGTPVFVSSSGEITKGPSEIKGQDFRNIKPKKEQARPQFTKKQSKEQGELYKQYKKEEESETEETRGQAWKKYRESIKQKFGSIEEKQREYDINKARNEVKSIVDNLSEISKKNPQEMTSLEYVVSKKAESIKSLEKDYKKFYGIASDYAAAINEKNWPLVDQLAKKIENMHGFKSAYARMKKVDEFSNLSNMAETLKKFGTFPDDLADIRHNWRLQDEHKDLVKKAAESNPESIGNETLIEYQFSDWMPPSLMTKADRQRSVSDWKKQKETKSVRRKAKEGRTVSRTANSAVDYYRQKMVSMQLPTMKGLVDKKDALEKSLNSLYEPWNNASLSQNQEEMERIGNEITENRNLFYQAEDEIQKQSLSGLLGSMGFSGRANIETKNAESLPKDQQDEVKKAVEWLSVVLTPSLEIGPINFEPMDTDAKGYDGRSYCVGNTVRLAPHAKADVIIHEIGHAIEHANNNFIGKKSLAFLHSKTFEQNVEHLGNGYSTHEVATKNGFMSAYTGKYYYGEGSTEILSMGLQSLFEDAYRFAKWDKDHFNYTIAAIRGLV